MFLFFYNLGFLSAATHRNIPSSLILFHRTQATTPPTSTPNVPARTFVCLFQKIFLFMDFRLVGWQLVVII